MSDKNPGDIRDGFAEAAMSALIQPYSSCKCPAEVADMSYDYADAMMARRVSAGPLFVREVTDPTKSARKFINDARAEAKSALAAELGIG